MTGETVSQTPYPEFELSEEELGQLNHADATERIVETFKSGNSYKANSLYSGVDGEILIKQKSFGDRRETWAMTEEEFRDGIQKRGGFDATAMDPIRYAQTASDHPAIAMFDKELFDKLDGAENGDFEWRLKDGATMDQAALGVIYLTH